MQGHQNPPQPARLDSPQRILVRYGELALKGGNRGHFEKSLALNIQEALEPISPVAIERLQGRFEVVPERRVEECAQRLTDVFGIKSLNWPRARNVRANDAPNIGYQYRRKRDAFR